MLRKIRVPGLGRVCVSPAGDREDEVGIRVTHRVSFVRLDGARTVYTVGSPAMPRETSLFDVISAALSFWAADCESGEAPDSDAEEWMAELAQLGWAVG